MKPGGPVPESKDEELKRLAEELRVKMEATAVAVVVVAPEQTLGYHCVADIPDPRKGHTTARDVLRQISRQLEHLRDNVGKVLHTNGDGA
jgi:hypothetical protein